MLLGVFTMRCTKEEVSNLLWNSFLRLFFTSPMLVLEEGFIKKQQDDAKIIACHVP